MTRQHIEITIDPGTALENKLPSGLQITGELTVKAGDSDSATLTLARRVAGDIESTLDDVLGDVTDASTDSEGNRLRDNDTVLHNYTTEHLRNVPVPDVTLSSEMNTDTSDDFDTWKGETDDTCEQDEDDLQSINGVGPRQAAILTIAGYETVDDIREASQEELADVQGIESENAARMKSDVDGTLDDLFGDAPFDDAEDVDDADEPSEIMESDDGRGHLALTSVSGVGIPESMALTTSGFDTVDDIRKASQEELADVQGIGDPLAARMKADVGGIQADTETEAEDDHVSPSDDYTSLETHIPMKTQRMADTFMSSRSPIMDESHYTSPAKQALEDAGLEDEDEGEDEDTEDDPGDDFEQGMVELIDMIYNSILEENDLTVMERLVLECIRLDLLSDLEEAGVEVSQ